MSVSLRNFKEASGEYRGIKTSRRAQGFSNRV